MITLITGGVKSGKSSHALELFQNFKKGIFIATTNPGDDSMREKIAIHQQERRGLDLETLEIQLDLSSGLNGVKSDCDVVIIDCITMWVANLMYMSSSEQMAEYILEFLNKAKSMKIDIIVITNEVGLGVIPENKLARDYSSELGKLNRLIAQIADKVILMVSGIPVRIK
jgi:adenosylcobinamide kinase/adenosylcobinamide-phosphate guanylyltransferase